MIIRDGCAHGNCGLLITLTVLRSLMRADARLTLANMKYGIYSWNFCLGCFVIKPFVMDYNY